MISQEYLIHFAKKHNLDKDEEILSLIESSYFDESLVPIAQEMMMSKFNNNSNGNEDNDSTIVNPDPFPPPPPELIQGELKLGHVFQTGDPVYLKLSSLNKNILITGAHGTGKTNIINLIIKGLLET